MRVELTQDELQYIQDLIIQDVATANESHADSIIIQLLFKLDPAYINAFAAHVTAHM